jgi:hypothetical protein
MRTVQLPVYLWYACVRIPERLVVWSNHVHGDAAWPYHAVPWAVNMHDEYFDCMPAVADGELAALEDDSQAAAGMPLRQPTPSGEASTSDASDPQSKYPEPPVRAYFIADLFGKAAYYDAATMLEKGGFMHCITVSPAFAAFGSACLHTQFKLLSVTNAHSFICNKRGCVCATRHSPLWS